jgi:hypothetical protein
MLADGLRAVVECSAMLADDPTAGVECFAMLAVCPTAAMEWTATRAAGAFWAFFSPASLADGSTAVVGSLASRFPSLLPP